MSDWEVYRAKALDARAQALAEVALATVERTYPNYVVYVSTGPDDLPPATAQHPVFSGSFDWHSCVEMHWAAARLLRLAPERVPAARIRAAFDRRLTPAGMAAELAYFARPEHVGIQRPYGWGWYLSLVHEVDLLATAGDADAVDWAARLRHLADHFVRRTERWLPRVTYPVRAGFHPNSAFGLSRMLPHARALAERGDTGLLAAIETAARRWYAADAGYPAAWEPSGADFLSPALVEAELLAQLLDPAEFAGWLDGFLPELACGRPDAVFTPAVVSDPTDGQIAHLHGLNLSRAWCWHRLASALPPDDARVGPMLAAARRHADAALDATVGGDYMVEHWLAAYAVLLLT